ncbi:MAG: hypothetical protein HYS23_06890 [Geobacter sp.]|nr:hypothetical protein [Geobacter sp.]
MKKKLLAGICAVTLVGSASLVFAGRLSYDNGGGITNSPHNMPAYLQAKGAAPETSQLCVFCHTPHNATGSGEAGYNPLWNHKMDTSTANFIPYEGIDVNDPDYIAGGGDTSFNALNGFGAGAYDVLKGPSRLCMSCHDGVTAIDAFSSGNNSVTLSYADSYDKKIMIGENISDNSNPASSNYFGATRDLRNDHPIGFSYIDVADGEDALGMAKDINIRNYATPVTTWLGAGKTSVAQIKDVLFKGEFLTCSSCHDVHNTDGTKTAGGSFAKPLLRVTTDGSALCLMCHSK